jgi:hypothetical protein
MNSGQETSETQFRRENNIKMDGSCEILALAEFSLVDTIMNLQVPYVIATLFTS